MIWANGSFGLKIWVPPSAGALNTAKNTIGHQLRTSAGTAIGTVPVAIGIEPRMRFGPDRHALWHLEIEQQLVGVEIVAEISKRRPLQAAVGRRSPIPLQQQFAVLGGDMQFVVVGIKQLDAVLRAFRKRNAVPDLFT